jgi:hypothetical protein
MILKSITEEQRGATARELHKEAAKLDKKGCAHLRRKQLVEGYNSLEIAKSLRVTANYMENIQGT